MDALPVGAYCSLMGSAQGNLGGMAGRCYRVVTLRNSTSQRKSVRGIIRSPQQPPLMTSMLFSNPAAPSDTYVPWQILLMTAAATC